jgi:hypothetical protein
VDEARSNAEPEWKPKETRMEIAPVVPEWLTWLAAAGVAMLAMAALARGFEAMLDLG